jgi:hypothetical protein
VSAADGGPDTRPRRIFISYARVDAPVAHQVEQILAQWGCQPWLDQRSLSGGQDWTVALEHAIDSSQALALILTSAALASFMVRREYERALERGISVLLIRAGSTGELPPSLAGAPLVNFQDKLHAGASLYFALADRGLIAPPSDDRLDSIEGMALFAVLEGRASPEWTVYQTPLSVYGWGVVQAVAPVLVALILATAAPYRRLRDAPFDSSLLLLAAIIACMVLTRMLLVYRRWDIFVLRGQLQRETIVREPEACSSFVMPTDRRQSAGAHRYHYRWVGAARARTTRWGETWVEFTNRTDGQTLNLSLPRRLPDRRAIAEQIVADVEAYNARQETLITGTASASLPTATPSAAPQAAPVAYCVIAPRTCGAVITSARRWLSTRGIAPAEMGWVADGGDLLLPTSRGAARSRFALFVDVPEVTQSPRCRVVLADLRARGVLLIPLRVAATQPEPSEWSSTQWVDFSPSASRDRSLIGLCDALDRAGLVMAHAHGAFDPDIALARGIFKRTPLGWSAFIGDPGMERALQRSHWLLAIAGAVSIIGLLALMGITSVQAIQSVSPSSSEYSSLMEGVIGLAVILALLSIPGWRMVKRQVDQARLHRGILHDRNAPQCVVVTPEGIAFHLVSASRGVRSLRASGASVLFGSPTSFLTSGFAFRDLAAVTAGRTWSGAPKLRLRTRQGREIDLPLASLLSRRDAAIAAATEAFAASYAPRPVAIG